MKKLSFGGVRRPRGTDGFTLVELLIASAVVGMIMLAIFAAWTSIVRGAKSGMSAASEAQHSRMAMRVMQDAFMGAEMYTQTIQYYAFLSDTSGDFSTVSFVSRLPFSFPRSGVFGDFTVRRVSFSVEASKTARNQLVMRQTPILTPPDADQDENPVILATNINQFTVEFWDLRKAEWVSDFPSTNTLPKMVRLTLGFASGKANVARPEDIVTRVVGLPAISVPISWQRPNLGPGAGGPIPGQPGFPGQTGVNGVPNGNSLVPAFTPTPPTQIFNSGK